MELLFNKITFFSQMLDVEQKPCKARFHYENHQNVEFSVIVDIPQRLSIKLHQTFYPEIHQCLISKELSAEHRQQS